MGKNVVGAIRAVHSGGRGIMLPQNPGHQQIQGGGGVPSASGQPGFQDFGINITGPGMMGMMGRGMGMGRGR